MVTVERVAAEAEHILADFPAADIELAGKGSADIDPGRAVAAARLIAPDSLPSSALRSYDRRQPHRALGCRIFDNSSLDL